MPDPYGHPLVGALPGSCLSGLKIDPSEEFG